MKKVKLTQGRFAKVDDKDFDYINNFKWCAVFVKGTWYATRRHGTSTQRMHRLIMDVKKGEEIDHINRDGLDNRRSNLRICTRSENLSNRRSWGSSKVKGISYHQRDKVWQAYIDVDGKRSWVGSFNSELEAVKALGSAT